MIELSFAGLIGAFAGTALAAFAYAPLVTALQRALGVRAPEEISLLRRAPCWPWIFSCSPGLATGWGCSLPD